MAWSFCWCRSRRSLRAKHLVHSWHSKGFSLVCDRSCRFRCSSLAKERPQVPQTCGLGLSVLGGGNWPFETPFCAAPFPLDAGRAARVSNAHIAELDSQHHTYHRSCLCLSRRRYSSLETQLPDLSWPSSQVACSTRFRSRLLLRRVRSLASRYGVWRTAPATDGIARSNTVVPPIRKAQSQLRMKSSLPTEQCIRCA